MSKNEKEKKTPVLRFEGFTDDWIKCKLKDIAELNPNSQLPEKFKYVDLESVVGTSLISYKDEKKSTAPSRAQRLAQNGDLFYQTVRPYQKNNYLFEKSSIDYVFSTGYAQIRPNINGQFLLNLVQNNNFVNSILKRCTGTSYPAINSNDLAETQMYIPNKDDERKKIGLILKALDKIITLEQEKLEKLKELKETISYKTIPYGLKSIPMLRFDTCNNNWKEIRLKTIFNLKNGYSFKSKNYTPVGKYKILTISNVTGSKFINVSKANKIDLIPKNIKKYQILEKNDIVISMTGNVGRVSIVNEKNLLMNQRVGLLSPKTNDFNINFLITVLQMPFFIQNMINKGQGAAQLNISKHDIENYSFKIPNSIKTQHKIGSLFDELDQIIIKNHEKLKKYRTLKNKLLEVLFI